MNLACVRPIVYYFTYLLSSCGTISDLCRGWEVHSLLISNGFASNIFAMTVVVNLYAKCRQMDDACKMSDRMPARDLVAWNTVVSGYSQNRLALQALDTGLRLQADRKMCEGLVQKAKDGGLDVVETNIFWNGHEPSSGSYNFEGRYDLVRFIKTVQNAGLYAHIRIGPHVFAKWNFGD